MKTRSYRCANCGGEFETDWTNEEADAEYHAVFTKEREAGKERAVVCDDCYERLIVRGENR